MGKSLAVTINENNNGNSDRIIFFIEDAKLYVPVVTLPARQSNIIKTF